MVKYFTDAVSFMTGFFKNNAAKSLKKLLLINIFSLITVAGLTQATIWEEDFESYSNNTGVQGSGIQNIGDYPGSVSKWTIDASGCTLADNNDYLKVTGNRFEADDIDGPGIWTTESININGYSDVSISVDAGESGNQGNNDYILLEYIIDGGAPQQFGYQVNDFSTQTFTATGLSGSTLIIRVTIRNDQNNRPHWIDKVTVSYIPAGYCTGNAITVTSQSGVQNSNNALGPADNNRARLRDTNDQMVLDLTGGDFLDSGGSIDITWKRSNGTPSMLIEVSTDNSSWTDAGTYSVTDWSYTAQTITLPAATRYIRITSLNNSDLDFDAVSYYTQCSPPCTAPTITNTTPGTRCGTGTVTLGATASAGTINWYSSPTGGSSLGTGTSFTTPSISTTTTYYVDATLSGCTTTSRTAVTATVTTTPTITGTTPGSRCGTGTIDLEASASAGTINWYSAPSGGSSLGSGTNFTTPSISSTTIYYVDATNNGCTTTSRTAVTATINTIPTITGTTPGSRVGPGTVNLVATASAGTINWYTSSSGGSSIGTGNNFTTPSISSTTTYYVDATSGGCTTTSRTAVIATVTAPAGYCVGNAISVVSESGVNNEDEALGAPDGTGAQLWDQNDWLILELTNGDLLDAGGTIDLRWRRASGTASNPAIRVDISPDGSNWTTVNTYTVTSLSFTTQTISLSVATRYVRFYDTNVYNLDLDAVSFNTPCTPPCTDPTITGTTPGSRCGTGTVELGATTSAGTINWYSVSTGGSSLGTGSNFTTPSISTTTTYYVDATDNGCTTATRTAIIATVNAIPTIIGTTPGSNCGTGTVVLGATASAGTINWYSAPTGGSSLGTGTSFTTPSISTTTTYYVDATNNGCTTASRTAIIATINTIPTITGTTPDSNCGTGTVTLGATASAGTINWYAAATGGSSLGTGTSFTTPSISSTTTYYVDAINNGCTSSPRIAIVATIDALPTFDLGANRSICIGDTAMFDLPNGNTYDWSPTTGVTQGADATIFIIDPSSTTTYTVTATAPNGCDLEDTWTATRIDCSPQSATQTHCLASDVTIYTTIAQFIADGGQVNFPCAYNANNITLINTETDGNSCPEIITQTYEIWDNCGNIVESEVEITIDDTEDPDWTTAASNLVLECDGTPDPSGAIAAWLAAYGGGNVSDNCATVTVTNDYSALSNLCGATGTTTVIFTATDICGNTATTSATVTINDNVAPVIDPSATDFVTDCNGSGNLVELNAWLTNNGGAVATDVCGTVTWSNNYSAVSDLCGASGTVSVIFTATDECGNSTSTPATLFTIQDTTSPIISVEASNLTVECDGSGNTTQLNTWLTNNGGATATDACGTVTWSNNFSSLSDDCGATGNATVIFTATDECGNNSTTTATFTIEDTTDPTFTQPANLTISCEQDPDNLTLTGDVTNEADACSSAPEATYTDDVSGLTGCNGTGTIIRTWTLTDDCGNNATHTQTITVTDNVDPTISCPTALNLVCNILESPAHTTLASFQSAGGIVSDNCAINASSFNLVSEVSDGNSCPEIVTRVYEIEDVCGNSAQCTQTISINETSTPSINCPPALTAVCDIAEQTPYAGYIEFITAGGSANDNCGINATSFAFVSDVSDNNTCPEVVTRTYQITDFCDNITTCTQLITIDDQIAPTLTAPANLTASCNISEQPAYSNLAAFIAAGGDTSDNCAIDVASFTHVGDVSDGNTCPEIVTRTYRIADLCGNTVTTTQTITVNDTEDPVITCPANLSDACAVGTPAYTSYAEFITAGGTITDNCSINESSFTLLSETEDGATCPKTVTRTYQIADVCGNTATCTQEITIDDVINPTLTCPPSFQQYVIFRNNLLMQIMRHLLLLEEAQLIIAKLIKHHSGWFLKQATTTHAPKLLPALMKFLIYVEILLPALKSLLLTII